MNTKTPTTEQESIIKSVIAFSEQNDDPVDQLSLMTALMKPLLLKGTLLSRVRGQEDLDFLRQLLLNGNYAVKCLCEELQKEPKILNALTRMHKEGHKGGHTE